MIALRSMLHLTLPGNITLQQLSDYAFLLFAGKKAS